MDILDIIEKKKNNNNLTYKELEYSFMGYLKKEIKDYQMSALLMAICIRGLSKKEIFALTDIFIKSGETLDLSSIKGPICDKHSTGGIGDKTTLIIGPLVASCGVSVPKMSGRGLGYTGGTIDKLESIPGFKTNLTTKDFINNVKEIGFSVTSQSKKLVPLDEIIYSLRSVTSTANSLPLIVISIMSKKIAVGSKNILLDINYGKGALLPNKLEAKKFAKIAVSLGKKYNRNVKYYISSMNIPDGHNIGNALEIIEAEEILKGKVGNLTNECIILSTMMVSMAKNISISKANNEVISSLYNGRALKIFYDFIKKQNGDLKELKISKNKINILSKVNGQVLNIDALKIGKLALKLGAGRINKSSIIDPSVGIIINKHVGDHVDKGDILLTLYVKAADKNNDYSKEVYSSYRIF